MPEARESLPLPFETVKRLKAKSIQYRRTILKIISTAKAGHTGGSLSCVDILNVLYNQVMDIRPETFARRDREKYGGTGCGL